MWQNALPHTLNSMLTARLVMKLLAINAKVQPLLAYPATILHSCIITLVLPSALIPILGKRGFALTVSLLALIASPSPSANHASTIIFYWNNNAWMSAQRAMLVLADAAANAPTTAQHVQGQSLTVLLVLRPFYFLTTPALKYA